MNSSSEDDIPISRRIVQKPATQNTQQQQNGSKFRQQNYNNNIIQQQQQKSHNLSNGIPKQNFVNNGSKINTVQNKGQGEKPHLGQIDSKPQVQPKKQIQKSMIVDSDSEDDDIPLSERLKNSQKQHTIQIQNQLKKPQLMSKQQNIQQKQNMQQKGNIEMQRSKIVQKQHQIQKSIKKVDKSPNKRKREDSKEDKSIKWHTLEHSGVLFPPEFEPHGIKMKYEGQPVDLTQQQEEIATMYAVMIETDYVKKPQFNKNFWEDFKKILGKNHIIKNLEKCDFKPIYEHYMAEKEKKKNISKEEKIAIKEDKDAKEAKYKTALVDGRQEGVGNFRVEPPGLFRGRGEHPKMGKIKRRIYPYDITINIGKNCPLPTHEYKGMSWKEIRHDNTVTWLAFWKDPIDDRSFKYVWLAANSQFKTDSDMAKYEKARRLKGYIDKIRNTYNRDMNSNDTRTRQMAVALYFIDKLALRAGHEKEDDEADTVGCCNLKVENVECIAPDQLKFDFLGKDSIRYENQVQVEPKVYKIIQEYSRVDRYGKTKKPQDQLFDTFDATDLNNEVKSYSEDLSVKVFRTYNASITLDRLLHEKFIDEDETVDKKKAVYDDANKEVAILCNHQRSIPKAHENQMTRMQDKLQALKNELQEIETDLIRARKGQELKFHKKGSEESLQIKLDKKLQQLRKAEVNAESKENLKTVALGTSKINYLDPRITVAWCKKNDVPLEKVFNKSLLSKFFWACDVEPEYVF